MPHTVPEASRLAALAGGGGGRYRATTRGRVGYSVASGTGLCDSILYPRRLASRALAGGADVTTPRREDASGTVLRRVRGCVGYGVVRPYTVPEASRLAGAGSECWAAVTTPRREDASGTVLRRVRFVRA